MTYEPPASGPIVPPAREGHRRRFSEADKRRIIEEAVQPGASLSEVVRLNCMNGSAAVSAPARISSQTANTVRFLSRPSRICGLWSLKTRSPRIVAGYLRIAFQVPTT